MNEGRLESMGVGETSTKPGSQEGRRKRESDSRNFSKERKEKERSGARRKNTLIKVPGRETRKLQIKT